MTSAMDIHDAPLTLETIAPSKLLNYVQKDALIAFLTPQRYAEIEHQLRTTLNKARVNLKDMKKFLSNQPDFVQSLRRSRTGGDAFTRYTEAVARLRNIDRAKASAVRKTMAEPRRRYQGCLATRLKPADYEHCLDHYDNEDYDGIKLVPSSLTQRVYDAGDVATRGVLQETITRRKNNFSDFPAGLRSYMRKHPDEFKDYYEQRRHEVGLLKAVLRNLSNEDKRKLQAYYQEHRTIEPEKFSDIIATFKASPHKRSRVVLEEETPSSSSSTRGGSNRFSLDDRIKNGGVTARQDDDAMSIASASTQFSDQSLGSVLYQD